MTEMTGNDVLMSSGKAPKAAEWPSDGWEVAGEIVGWPKKYQVREYDKDNPTAGKLKFYPSGDPVLGVIIDLKTALRDIGNPEDNGVRRAYIDRTRMLTAVRDAVRTAGAEGVEPGGFLSVTRTGTEQGQGSIPAITWAARYAKPGQWTKPTPIPTGPPAWAAGTPQSPPAVAPPPVATGWQGPAPTQPYSGSQAPVPAQSVATMPQATVPQPSAPVTDGRPTLKASAAAALANGGVDISAFNIVPD